MKIALLVLALAVTLAICEAKKCKEYSEKEIETEFEEHISKKNKKEFKQVEEKTKKKKSKDERKKLFKQKMKGINKFNKKSNPSFCQGPNQFTAMEDEEIQMMLKTTVIPDDESIPVIKSAPLVEGLPAEVDHSTATGPVENQGSCGSCWAFAASHTLTGSLVSLGKQSTPTQYSEEQLVDCSKDGGSGDGCQGGYMDIAWDYLKTHEFKTDAQYPYVGSKSECSATDAGSNFLVSGWARTSSFGTVDNEATQTQLAKQPLALAMYVTGTFMQYNGGIYDNTADCATIASNAVNHGMVIVGYGEENGVPYWKIKNSWGGSWGEGGFVRVKRGINLCNCEIDNMFPILVEGGEEGAPVPPPPAPVNTCVDEAKQCANYGSEACRNDEYQGDKKETKTGTACYSTCPYFPPICRNPDADQAPWCFTQTSWDYCLPPCAVQW
jgi:cathepsin L